MTPKRTLIWDENNKAQNLANAIWKITVNEILTYRTSLEKIYIERVTKIFKGEIVANCEVYSNKNLSREIGKLGLIDFMASQPVTGI